MASAAPMRRERLTERDRQLMVMLATARYLSTAQLVQVGFRGKHVKRCLSRLRVLAAEGKGGVAKPYLRRIRFRSHAGHDDVAWALTPLGYWLAGEVSGRALRGPRLTGRDEFLDHALTLNELLVRLVEPHLDPSGCVRATRLPWRWVSSESARLPWREYLAAGKTRERLILPDAVLELPAARRRIFLECEMGTHSIESATGTKPGATIAKAERYESFVMGFAEAGRKTTFYEKTFPDAFTPEVLFVVPSAVRAANINSALQRWSAGRGVRRLALRALVVEEAAAQLLPLTGVVAPPPAAPPPGPAGSPSSLSDADRRLLATFVHDTIAHFKSARAEARVKGVAPPAYPSGAEQVRELVLRWSGGAGVARGGGAA